jgi:hypothetical protein
LHQPFWAFSTCSSVMLLFMRIGWLSANEALGPVTSRGNTKAL